LQGLGSSPLVVPDPMQISKDYFIEFHAILTKGSNGLR